MRLIDASGTPEEVTQRLLDAHRGPAAVIVGQDRAVEQFASAWATRKLHHAWLLAGPKGVGKASFAHAAARRVLAEAAGPPFDSAGLETPDDHPIVKLVEAGSHPDMRWLERLVNEKTGNLARNISVDQVRELGEFMTLTPGAFAVAGGGHRHASTSSKRRAPNALLKMLEEPPANTLFFLVSHAPGRLLPTIRSRCRRLDFQPLDDDAMTSILEAAGAEPQRAPSASGSSPCPFGSAGRALAFAELDLAKLEDAALAILRQGDPTNARRSDLATRAWQERRGRALCRFPRPRAVADRPRGAQRSRARRGNGRSTPMRRRASSRRLRRALSLDPAATVFQIGGILAEVAGPLP